MRIKVVCQSPCCRTATNIAPYCWRHALKLAKIKVRDSTIPGAGKGLFAQSTWRSPAHGPRTLVFKKKDVIAEYLGEVIDEAELGRRYGTERAPYTIWVCDGTYVDAARLRSYAAMANDARGHGRCNARFTHGSATRPPEIRATRDIYNGDEILVSYGDAYWS